MDNNQLQKEWRQAIIDLDEAAIRRVASEWRQRLGSDTWPGLLEAQGDDFWRQVHSIRSSAQYLPSSVRWQSQYWLEAQTK